MSLSPDSDDLVLCQALYILFSPTLLAVCIHCLGATAKLFRRTCENIFSCGRIDIELNKINK